MARVARSAVALGATFAVGTGAIAVASVADLPSAGCAPIQSVAECSAQLIQGETPNLRYGNDGAEVQRVQTLLNNLGFSGPTTSFFGPATRTQVQAYQASRGIAATGEMNSDTWAALQEGRTQVAAQAETIAYTKPATSTSPSLTAINPAVAAKVAPVAPAPTEAPNATPVAKLKSMTIKNSGGLRFPGMPDNPTQAKVISFAMAQLGKMYQFGSTGPNTFDCSGLVLASWRAAGISVPRVSSSQATLPRVSSDNLQPGDIIVNNGGGHAMLYIGGGLIIEAYSTGHPVRVAKLSQKGSFVASRPSY